MLQYNRTCYSFERQHTMKKQILFCITIVSVLVLLSLFAIWQSRSVTGDPSLSLPEESCDALVLVDPSKHTQSNRYDLKQIKKESTTSEHFLPVISDPDTSLYYQKDLTVHINRSLDLSEENLCHYGLFEKTQKQFAVFYAEISTQQSAERLCHLLLCYRDYFPTLLFGEFDKATHQLITEVCKFSSATLNGVTYFYQNISVTPHENSGSLLLQFDKAPRTLDLNKKMIALTFDDGPSDYTNDILETIAKYSAKATFFVNGTHVTEYPEAIQNIFAQKCEIGNHTNLHELFTHNTQGIIRKSIEETNKKVRNVIGIGTFVVRPPGGETLDRYQKPVKIGYPIVRWSLDTLDYTENKTAELLLEAIQQTQHGEIILMHDTKSVTAEAADRIVSYLVTQNFQLVTVSELLEFTSDGALADRIYNNTYPTN